LTKIVILKLTLITSNIFHVLATLVIIVRLLSSSGLRVDGLALTIYGFTLTILRPIECWCLATIHGITIDGTAITIHGITSILIIALTLYGIKSNTSWITNV
jgi:hypothetical protein